MKRISSILRSDQNKLGHKSFPLRLVVFENFTFACRKRRKTKHFQIKLKSVSLYATLIIMDTFRYDKYDKYDHILDAMHFETVQNAYPECVLCFSQFSANLNACLIPKTVQIFMHYQLRILFQRFKRNPGRSRVTLPKEHHRDYLRAS